MIQQSILSKEGCRIFAFVNSGDLPVLAAQAPENSPGFVFTDLDDIEWLIRTLVGMREECWEQYESQQKDDGPEPAPEPERELEPWEDGYVDPQWKAVVEEFSAKFPLSAGYLSEVSFRGFREHPGGGDRPKDLILSASAENHRMALQSLERPTTRAALEEMIHRVFGARHLIRCMVEVTTLVPLAEYRPEPEAQ